MFFCVNEKIRDLTAFLYQRDRDYCIGDAKDGRKALAQLLAKPSFHWRCMGLPALRIVIWLRNAAFETLR